MADTLATTDERVLAKLVELADRFCRLESQMRDPAMAGDHVRYAQIAQEYGQMKRLVVMYHRYQDLVRQHGETLALEADAGSDEEMRALATEELRSLAGEQAAALNQAKELLVMSDDAGVGAVIIEIRAGTGGDEAALFARDLHGMYVRYAEKQKWRVEPLSFSSSELGGFKEVIIGVKGQGVWQALGYEGGGHRVQRVPETEAQGRIHTSAATVAVLPEPEAVDIEINDADVVEHVSRSGGPGGQSVNKLNSAIKLEHKPTGITVSMQDEKSQHKNRAKAWRILRSRVYDQMVQKQRAQRDSARKDMIGSGDRSQRIRTYNFPQNRVTDHRINLTLYSLDKIIMGDLDGIVGALVEYDKRQRLDNL